MEYVDWELKTERYLNGTMTSEEILLFEEEQASNLELKAYVDLSIQLKQALNEKDWFDYKERNKHYNEVKSWYESDDTLAFKKQIEEQANIHFKTNEIDKKSFSKPYYWISAAAVILILIAITYQFTGQPNMKSLYANYATWDDLPTFIVQDDNTIKTEEDIELSFRKGNYTKCISIADLFLKHSNEKSANVLIYKGVALLELDKTTEALKVFETLSQSNSIDASKGLWYSALVHLKTENKEQVIITLKKITSSKRNYKYNEALKLLNKIK